LPNQPLSCYQAFRLFPLAKFPQFSEPRIVCHPISAARKEQRKAIKAEQAEAAKQARIEQLQAEIDELKKDE